MTFTLVLPEIPSANSSAYTTFAELVYATIGRQRSRPSDAVRNVQQSLARDPKHSGSLALLQELQRPAVAQVQMPQVR